MVYIIANKTIQYLYLRRRGFGPVEKSPFNLAPPLHFSPPRDTIPLYTFTPIGACKNANVL